jgi:uncharacterized membrane protein (DUF485 family)
MLHEPAAVKANDPASAYKAKLGARMFLVYALIYVGFVAINLIDPSLMEATVLAGLNLAVVYGFGLIVVALIMAVIYNDLCSREEARLEALEKEAGVA